MELRQSIVVVSGASRGIGYALKKTLSQSGATVITCSRSGGDGDLDHAVDVQNADEVHAFVAQITKKYGRIDLLINNAGVSHAIVPLEKICLDDYLQCMRTNVDGVFHLLQAVLPVMKQQDAGMVINIGSRAGTRAHPGLTVYSASKFAVKGLTQGLARELNEAGVNVSCISVSPGPVNTQMCSELFGSEFSDSKQSAETVADLIQGIVTGEIDAPSGSDVIITDGTVAAINPPAEH